MITNDTFYGLVFERDRVRTLLDNCASFHLSGMLEYIIDRRFSGWNKSDDCFRTTSWDVSAYDILFSFFQKGRITFDDLLAAYNRVTFSSINPKYQSYYVPAGTVVEDDTPALTDDFVDEQMEITLNNPRWEHKDTKKKENSPKTAAFDDNVILMADVTGIPENGSVTFDIFDTSGKAPAKIDSARGKNVGGVAKGEWVVTDKSGKGKDAKLEFQVKVKDKTSTRCKIPVVQQNSWGICVGPDDEVLQKLPFEIISNGEVLHTGKTDDDGNIIVPFDYEEDMEIHLFNDHNA
jgi:hypothetical protein